MDDSMKTKPAAISGMMGSYNSNSLPEFVAIQSSMSMIERAIDVVDIHPSSSSSSPLIIADFGCSHGANSIYAMKTIINLLKQSKNIDRSFLVIHNDLPTNNWTSFFNVLSENESYFGVANGCSFYSQCLPSNSVTISYSSTAIHWLSRKPCNISNHCLSLFAQGEQLETFRMQAQVDYIQFLKHRSSELTSGGVLILGIPSIDEDEKNSTIRSGYDLLYQCAQLLPLNEEELLNYTIPMHRRTYRECCNEEIFRQCSFQLITSDCHLTKSDVYEKYRQGQLTLDQVVEKQTNFMRSWSEASLKHTLEANRNRSKEEINQLLDRFWSLYEEKVKEKPNEHDRSSWQTFLVLKKV